MNTSKKNKSALNYFGGKSRFLDFLFEYFPEPHPVHAKGFLEGFVGGASVFLNCPQYDIMVINDVDKRLFNFFKVLRTHPKKLINLLQLTTYSRNEFQEALEISDDPIEDARRYFVRSQQSFGGQSHGTRRKNSWRASIQESKNGMSLDVSKWLGKIGGLKETVERFKLATIENRSFEQVKPKFDKPYFFHYDDPPYIHSVRSSKADYEHEFTNEQHKLLAEINNSLTAKVMISGYDCPEYNQWYAAPKWKKILGPVRATNLGKSRHEGKRECIWINYNPPGESHYLFND